MALHLRPLQTGQTGECMISGARHSNALPFEIRSATCDEADAAIHLCSLSHPQEALLQGRGMMVQLQLFVQQQAIAHECSGVSLDGRQMLALQVEGFKRPMRDTLTVPCVNEPPLPLLAIHNCSD